MFFTYLLKAEITFSLPELDSSWMMVTVANRMSLSAMLVNLRQ